MAKTKKVAVNHQNKRYGKHKKHSHSFRKVYWPYIPMLVMLFIVLVVGSAQPGTIGKVLGANSNIDNLGLLSATNSERTERGINALTMNQLLNDAAKAKANDMNSRDYWSHNTPDGSEPWIFIEDAQYEYQKAGENLAYGFSTNTSTVSGWMNSQSHRENMLDSTYTEVGFGVVNADNYQNKGPQTIVVAYYATPQSSNSPALAQTSTLPVPPESAGSIPLITSVSGRYASWLSFVIGALTGLSASLLIVRHGLRLKRMIHRGEHFIMHHPVLDLSLTGVIAVGVTLLQTVGFVG